MATVDLAIWSVGSELREEAALPRRLEDPPLVAQTNEDDSVSGRGSVQNRQASQRGAGPTAGYCDVVNRAPDGNAAAEDSRSGPARDVAPSIRLAATLDLTTGRDAMSPGGALVPVHRKALSWRFEI